MTTELLISPDVFFSATRRMQLSTCGLVSRYLAPFNLCLLCYVNHLIQRILSAAVAVAEPKLRAHVHIGDVTCGFVYSSAAHLFPTPPASPIPPLIRPVAEFWTHKVGIANIPSNARIHRKFKLPHSYNVIKTSLEVAPTALAQRNRQTTKKMSSPPLQKTASLLR